MSSLKHQFLADFALFEKSLIEAGEPAEGIEEIKQAIRNDWEDAEKRSWWVAYVKKEADFERKLIGLAQGITRRIKTQQRACKREESLSEKVA